MENEKSEQQEKNMEDRKCKICSKSFVPNKYRPNQEICSSLECQYQRQLMNMREWRTANPNYFKYKEAHDDTWKQSCRERSLDWRKKHRDYLQLYREANKERHRTYMREYMRQYRQKQKEGENTEPEKPETPPAGTQ
ncbi:hypothetical protein OMAG_002681 [Candidatus Omnitrophus magneticus]|uniref:Uncharacterized protein n=1 Tax=Candidatus Omnitrophus magneticus TaxID=1609969 RepID=A0A0F0CJG1_9BACT|nr:hypothetical protein OMAG_002681 [Candidatus Omnitrophus magneticus]